MSTARSAATKPRFVVPLDIAVALLLIGAVLSTGAILGFHYYRQTSHLVLEASGRLFDAMGREVAQELARTAAPVQSLVGVLATQTLPDTAKLEYAMDYVPALVEALRGNPALAAIYFGYENGAFFLVRTLRDPRVRDALRTPPGAAYAVQTVVPSSAGSRTSFRYLRDDLSTIEFVARPDFAFDPRTRDWYRDATRADGPIRTDPYVFFTTQEPGITIARTARAGNAVVGADVTLENLSALLRSQNVAPSTELFLLTHDGRVLARNLDKTTSQSDSTAGLGLPSLAESTGSTTAALAARFASSARERDFDFHVAGVSWIGGFDRIDAGRGAPLYLAAASPSAELLAGAQRIRADGWIVTALLIAGAIPLAWLTASRVSRPLHRLAVSAGAMRAFDFAYDARVRSTVREIDQLGLALAEGKATVRHFLDISGALAAERDLERLIARVLDEVMRLAKADAGVIYLVDSKQRALTPAQYLRRDDTGGHGPCASIALDSGDAARSPIARAATSGETVLVDVAAVNLFVTASDSDETGRQGEQLVGATAIPLRNRSGDVDGVLCLLHDHVRATDISRDAVTFVERLSGVAAIAIETQRLIGEQKALLESFIQLIAAAIDAKSPYTSGHCQRVPVLTKMLAQAACDARDGPFRDFTLDEDAWEEVRIASWLHDCGKVTTPEYVVDKATKLETLCDRIHEIRMRFEVLKRDAETAYWKGRAEGRDEAELRAACERECDALDADFGFVAACNLGGESLAKADIDRLDQIAQRTWLRTLDDRLGVSWEERKRMEHRDSAPLPVSEPLLADKPEHVIERTATERIAADNPWGFNLRQPTHRYDRGELHNLKVARGTLTEEERYKINDHIVQTIIMLDKLPFPRHLKHVPELAGCHHEKMDGSGYPRGLARNQMSPVARMMAIADVFEALTAADRPYKKGKTLSEALGLMARMSREQHIDGDLFELFLTADVHRQYAERFLSPEQIDHVDIGSLIATQRPSERMQ